MSEQEYHAEPEDYDEIKTPFEDPADDYIAASVPGKTEQNTVTFKRSHLYTVLLPLAFVAGLTLGFIFWGRDTGSKTAQPPVAVVPQADSQPAAPANPQEVESTPEIRRYDVPEDDDPTWGPQDAPITIIEFSDYECPYCRKWHVDVWPQLQATYEDQIRLVYRDFPLTSIHSNATPAAAAANCADRIA